MPPWGAMPPWRAMPPARHAAPHLLVQVPLRAHRAPRVAGHHRELPRVRRAPRHRPSAKRVEVGRGGGARGGRESESLPARRLPPRPRRPRALCPPRRRSPARPPSLAPRPLALPSSPLARSPSHPRRSPARPPSLAARRARARAHRRRSGNSYARGTVTVTSRLRWNTRRPTFQKKN